MKTSMRGWARRSSGTSRVGRNSTFGREGLGAGGILDALEVEHGLQEREGREHAHAQAREALSRQIVLTPEEKETAIQKVREAFAEHQKQKAAAAAAPSRAK